MTMKVWIILSERQCKHPRTAEECLAKKVRPNLYKTKAPKLEETMESQLLVKAILLTKVNMMNQGRLMHLKLDMDKFPDPALTLDDFVIVMKEVIQRNMSTDQLTLIS